jgi:ectoine hydroxylase-related dioxygenase (phytanoyl-CoA dioxygenase family)
MFDEAWECFHGLRSMLALFLGEGYRALPDFWAWHVDPQAAQAGWAPHRDKGRMSLAADGTPLSLTVWIPLTEATPQNGCIYVLPANRDPVYGTENENNLQIDLTQIRALPGKPGDFICWSQAVLHWGAATSRFASHPRISMGVDFQRSDATYPEPELLISPFTNLSFDQRIKLIARQIPRYQRTEDPRFTRLAEQLLA